MRTFVYFIVLGAIGLILQGCYSKYPLTMFPSRHIDTWLLGVWEYSDKKGNRYQAGVFPLDTSHYSIEIRPLAGANRRLGARYFTAYISQVNGMYFLNLFPRKSVSSAPEKNSVFLAHYQLQSPIEVVVTPLHLVVSGQPTSWKLRQQIRLLKKSGALWPPQESTFWKKTSEVYWQRNASLEAQTQPKQPLRIPIPNPAIPSQDAALQMGAAKGYQPNRK